MNKSDIITHHTNAVIRLREHRKQHANSFGDFLDEHAKACDKAMQREVSNLGQIHNPRISKKSLAAIS